MVGRVMGAIQRQVSIETGEAYTGTADRGESVVVVGYGVVDAESNRVILSEAAAEALLSALIEWNRDGGPVAKCPHCGVEGLIDDSQVDEDGDGAYCMHCGHDVRLAAIIASSHLDTGLARCQQCDRLMTWHSNPGSWDCERCGTSPMPLTEL